MAEKKLLLSGFGHGYEIVDVYKVSDVELSGVDEDDRFVDRVYSFIND